MRNKALSVFSYCTTLPRTTTIPGFRDTPRNKCSLHPCFKPGQGTMVGVFNIGNLDQKKKNSQRREVQTKR